MGIAERYLRAGSAPTSCDHHTFVIAGDGCLEEGVSHEAASLAGHLKLGRLVYVYDDNHITIDGPTELTYSDDAGKRFEAYGWHVDRVGEVANDIDALEEAVRRAMAEEDPPSLIILRSHIGWPSPNNTDTADAHGNPLGDEESRSTKELPRALPNETSTARRRARFYRGVGCGSGCTASRGTTRSPSRRATAPTSTRHSRAGASPAGRRSCRRSTSGEKVATRRAVSTVLNAPARRRARLMAGGADLTGNTGTDLKDAAPVGRGPAGRQIHFGVREHGMAGIMNGMALHGGVLPVGGTFFVFSDYMRGAVRLAALSQAQVVYVLDPRLGRPRRGRSDPPADRAAGRHAGDAAACASIRPADANETAVAWRIAVDCDGPTALSSPARTSPCSTAPPTARSCAARTCSSEAPRRSPSLVLIGTGSEVVGVPRRRSHAREPTGRACASCRCRPGTCSRRNPRRTATRCCRRRAALRSRRRRRSAGSAGPTPPSASTGSAHRHPGEVLDKLGFNADNVAERARACSKTATLRGGRREPTARALRRAGPEPWLDNLKRGWITSGELERGRRGVRGITSNPTIFQKAIEGSADYDEQFRVLAGRRRPSLEDYWELVTQDIDDALDVLPRSTRRAAAATASCRSRSRPSSPATPTAPSTPPGSLHAADRPAEPVREDPGHGRGRPGDPADDQRGPQHQRHVVFSLERYGEVIEAYLRVSRRARATCRASPAWRRSS